MSPEPNSEIKLRLSAYFGNILLMLIVGVTIGLILYAGLGNLGKLLFLVFFLFLILYLVKIKKTIVIFGNDGNLSVESGYLVNSVKKYPLYHLTNVTPKQSLFNRITDDGMLVLTFALPNERRSGNVMNKKVVLKGLGKWRNLKNLANELSLFIENTRRGVLEEQNTI